MTLKTTKERIEEMLSCNRNVPVYKNADCVLVGDLQNLCHDADRAEELEKELSTREKCAYIGPMRDCPTHGESEELKRLKQENADLRAKLKYYEDALYSTSPSFVCVDHGIYATPISHEKVVDILRERDDLRAKLEETILAMQYILEWEKQYPTGTIYNSTESMKLELELTGCIERFRVLIEQEKP